MQFRPSKGNKISTLLKSLTLNVKLFIKRGDRYRFEFIKILKEDAENNNVRWLGDVLNEVMTADLLIDAPFTGLLLGLYAFGELEGCLAPADFYYAEFR